MPVLTVPIVNILGLTPRTRLFRLGIGEQPFPFLAGQAVLAAAHGHHHRRPYSIACSPERALETGTIELLVAVEPSSDADLHVSRAAVGDCLDLEGPLGQFTFPDSPKQERVLFVAGGTGIAPLRAMLDHALRSEKAPRMAMMYSARRSDEFAFIDELRGHERAGRLELHQTVTRDEGAAWEGARGRVGRTHFASVLPEPAHTLCFVCGPPPFVVESKAALSALGVPDALIRTEHWER